MELGEPLGAQRARNGIPSRGAVDEDHEVPASLGRPLDHERVSEVRRVEPADDQ